MEHLEKCKEQFQYAMAVPKELFDIGMHKYVNKYSDIKILSGYYADKFHFAEWNLVSV